MALSKNIHGSKAGNYS